MAKSRGNKSLKSGKKFCIIASRFHEFIAERLLKACIDEFNRQGIKKEGIETHWVPGSFELPVVALALAKKKTTAAVICLGAVIRGETYHFELVAQNAARGISEAALLTGKPVIFGVLTTDTVDQAYKRSEPKGHNKGQEAAKAAIEMLDLLNQL